MRPQKLTLKNFMPFRVADGLAHEVDFSPLDLFAITGPMASGKSSVIDAIVWCLYGRTARYGADSKGVISAGENFCEVALDFTLGSRWFRAVRRTGKTTESGLSEREGEEWIQDTSGSEQLTKRIEALLGLDFASFTKTVILPQGSYAEFLLSEPNKRRELLARILELGVYSRVAERAKEMAGQAKVRADTIRETLAQYAGVSREQVEQRRAEWQVLGKHIEEAAAQEDMLRGLVEKTDRMTAAISRITELQAEEYARTQETNLARQKHAGAEAHQAALTRALAQTAAERAVLGYDSTRHEVVKRAVVHLRAHQTACQEVEQKNQMLALAEQELDTLARQIAEQEQHVDTARRTHQERATAVQAEIAACGDVASLTKQIEQAKRWKELQQERTQLTEQQHSRTQRLARVQQSLDLFRQQETTKEQELRALHLQRDRAQNEAHAKERLEMEAQQLGRELQEAARGEKRAATAAEAARTALQTAEQEVQQQWEAVTCAEQQEQSAVRALGESQRRHEVEHLRETLRFGEPCPVCQTPVHEIPSLSQDTKDDLSALRRAVDAAGAALAQARQTFQATTAAVAVAHTKKEAAERDLEERAQQRGEVQERFVAWFPGFPSLATALTGLQSQRQEIVKTLQSLETTAQVLETEKRGFTQQREQAQREDAQCAEALHGIATRLANDEEQLQVLTQTLAPYLSSGGDPEAALTTRRQVLIHAQDAVKVLEHAHRQAEETLRAFRTRQVQQKGDLRLLASQRDAAAAQTEREVQAVREGLKLAVDAPLPDLAVLEDEFVALMQKQEQQTALLQREEMLRTEREQAEKQALELQADLRACGRELDRVRQEVARAGRELETARTELRADIARNGMSGIGPDGAGLKERLDSIRGRASALREQRGRLEMEIAEQERRCAEKEQEEEKLRVTETEGRLATDLHKLLGAEFTDFLSQGAVEALMRDATVHLQRLTHGRYAFDIAYKRRAIELQIVDHEDVKRTRPTHSLSGGETFLASLAIALALAQGFRAVATGKAAKTSTECLILDEGFGTLDREGLQLVTETLQELRGEEGRMVGIISHVEEVASAMPMRITVRKGSRTSTITVGG